MRRGFAILLLLLLPACNRPPESASPDSPSNQAHPIPAKLSWSAPIPPRWVAVPMDSIERPRDTTIDMRRLETRTLTGSGFIELRKPISKRHLDLASLPDTVIEMSKLATVPLRLRTSILGEPKKYKVGHPRLRDGATASVLVYGQETDLTPSSNVHQTMQDAHGRLWFAAIGGLTMYDGEYSYVYSIEQGLNSLQPWSLIFDDQGRLWCGGFSGIDILDFDRGIIQHIVGPDWINNAYIFNLGRTSEGKILACSGFEFSIIDPDKLTLQRIGNGQGLRGSACRSVVEDKSHRLWFGTNQGIAVLDPSQGRLRYLGGIPEIMGQEIMRLHEDARGAIWFTTQLHGVYSYYPATGELSNITVEHGLVNQSVRALAEDLYGNIYIGCAGTDGGLCVIDPTRTMIRTILPEGGLPSSFINDLYFDREQQLWITSPLGGICQLSTHLGELEHYARANGLSGNIPNALMEDSDGSLWIGSEGGIDIITKQHTIRHISLRQLQTTRRIVSLARDSRGNVWIGLNAGGVVVLDPRTGYLVNYGQEQGICNYDIRRVLEDSKGNIWVSSIAGVNQFNAQRSTNRYLDHHHGLSHYSVIDLLEDPEGRIWFANGGGVDVYDPRTEELRHLHNTDRNHAGFACCFMLDAKGRVWVGTEQDGIHIIDLKSGTERILTMEEGMSSNYVRSLLQVNGVVYAGTRKGLSTIIELEDGSMTVTAYSKAQGIPFLDFLHRSAVVTSDERIWWGLGSSITTLKPAQRSVPTPPTFISAIDLNEKALRFVTERAKQQQLSLVDPAVHATGNIENSNEDPRVTHDAPWSRLSGPYHIPDTLRIDEANNHVTFHFTATRVDDPAQTLYSYTIEGLDKGWSAASDRPYADYRNIPTGRYTFKVRSCGTDRHWSQAAVLHFSVVPPWWASAWAYGFYGLSLIGGVIVLLRHRHDKLLLRQRELELAVQARTQDYVAQKTRAEHSERIKEQFLANMSHEIRTPMNAVIGITNILLKKDHPPEQRPYLESMRRSSEGLLVILNDILDLSKIEAGMITIESIPFDVREVLSIVVSTLQFKAMEKSLELTHEIDAEIPSMVIGDPTRLQQILINLVGNALKFTESGKVRVVCELKARSDERVTLSFRVIDTGIGMSDGQLAHIFESFTQASSDTTRKYGGTGLGLSISRQLVNLLGGDLTVTSEFKRGSTFTFDLEYPIVSSSVGHEATLPVPADLLSRLDGIRILLAEDNELNRVVTRDTLALELPHLTMDEATNGDEACKMLADREYDLVLMDVNMPVLDGYAATRRIRRELPAPKCETPILALTAAAVRTELDRMMQAGMNGYVTKPFKTSELLLAMYNALDGSAGSLLSAHEIDRDASLDHTRITNLGFLQELAQGDSRLVSKYISMYLESTRTNLHRIEQDMLANDLQAIGRTMHQLKSHLKLMGMTGTAELAAQIEEFAGSGNNSETYKGLLERLRQDCERSFSELHSKRY